MRTMRTVLLAAVALAAIASTALLYATNKAYAWAEYQFSVVVCDTQGCRKIAPTPNLPVQALVATCDLRGIAFWCRVGSNEPTLGVTLTPNGIFVSPDQHPGRR